jgi:stalled ribosome alternative rescue factor ArfA
MIWDEYLKDRKYAIRNAYNGTYIHKTLFRVRVFHDRKDALKYIRKCGMNEKIYEVVEI